MANNGVISDRGFVVVKRSTSGATFDVFVCAEEEDLNLASVFAVYSGSISVKFEERIEVLRKDSQTDSVVGMASVSRGSGGHVYVTSAGGAVSREHVLGE